MNWPRGIKNDRAYPIDPFRPVFRLRRLKKKIIPNIGLAVFLFVAFLVNLPDISRLFYLPAVLLVSFLLYYVGFWGAGDGKLFFVYSVYLTAFVGNGLAAMWLNLLCSVSLCYMVLFIMLLARALRSGQFAAAASSAVKRMLSERQLTVLLASISVLVLLASFKMRPLEIYASIVASALFLAFGFSLSSQLRLLYGKQGEKLSFAPFLLVSTLSLILANL